MKKHKINSGLGISTLLMIFTVLCLTIFATLTYLQANYNYKQSYKILENKQNYYDSDYQALNIYRELKEKLDDNTIDEAWLNVNDITMSNGLYCYNIDINENSYLKVELQYSDDSLQIITWQQVSNSDGDYDYQGFVD